MIAHKEHALFVWQEKQNKNNEKKLKKLKTK